MSICNCVSMSWYGDVPCVFVFDIIQIYDLSPRILCSLVALKSVLISSSLCRQPLCAPKRYACNTMVGDIWPAPFDLIDFSSLNICRLLVTYRVFIVSKHLLITNCTSPRCGRCRRARISASLAPNKPMCPLLDSPHVGV